MRAAGGSVHAKRLSTRASDVSEPLSHHTRHTQLQVAFWGYSGHQDTPGEGSMMRHDIHSTAEQLATKEKGPDLSASEVQYGSMLSPYLRCTCSIVSPQTLGPSHQFHIRVRLIPKGKATAYPALERPT